MRFFRRFKSDKSVQKTYTRAGLVFGDAVSYLYMGECVGFDFMHKRWQKWEEEYALRGYRTVSLDDFISAGGYGKNINHLLGQKREANEQPIYHATRFEEEYNPQPPVVTMDKLNKQNPNTVQYHLPSTKEQ